MNLKGLWMSLFWDKLCCEHHGQHTRRFIPCSQQSFDRGPPVEQQIVINGIFVGKLCHADAGLHLLFHEYDFEVAKEVRPARSLTGDRDFTKRRGRGYGKNRQFFGSIAGNVVYPSILC